MLTSILIGVGVVNTALLVAIHIRLRKAAHYFYMPKAPAIPRPVPHSAPQPQKEQRPHRRRRSHGRRQ